MYNDQTMDLAATLEAVLFFKAEPIEKTALAKLLAVEDAALAEGLSALRTTLEGRGLRLLETGTEVTLVTAPELAPLLEQIRKDELRRDIGKAGAETLAIVVYRGPVSRAEIDYIRGVNSSFILRNLLTRGLVERITDPQNARTVKYTATPSLLEHLGVTQKTELPDYAAVMTELERFEREHAEEETTTT